MSHSQFHSINLFILRHAWLNLWDKHMTTGRINQVTTFRPCIPKTATHDSHNMKLLSRSGVHQMVNEFGLNLWTRSAVALHTSDLKSKTKSPCSPISQFSDTLLTVNKQRLWPSKRTTNNQLWCEDTYSIVTADSQVVKCDRSGHQQVIHTLPHC